MQKITLWPWKLPKIFSLCLISFILSVIIIPSVGARLCFRYQTYYKFLLAEQKIQEGNLEEAADYLEYIIKCDRKALFPYKELTKVYAKLKKYDQAIDLAQKVLKIQPDDKETKLILAKLYLMQNRPLRALTTLEDLLEKDPSYDDALSLMIMIYLKQRKIDKAISSLQKFLGKDPNNPLLWKELARLYREKGEDIQAEEAYKKALHLKPDVLPWILEYGDFLQKRKKFQEAEELFKKFLRNNPDNFHIQQALLQLYLKEHKYKEALQTVEQMEERIGPQPQLELKKALLLLDLSQDQEAVKILEKLLEKDPENDIARFYLGIALEKIGKVKKALHEYESISPRSQIFTLAIRRLAVLLKNPEELKGLFERALENNPEDKDLYLLASTTFEDLDRCDIGYEILSKGLEQFPEDRELILSKGFLLICMGKDLQALKTVEPLLKEYPEDPTILNFVGYTYADLDLDLNKAEKLIKKALEIKPDDGYILDSLAWVYFHKGQYQKALKIIDQALDKIQDDPIIYEHKADILKAQGKKKKALYFYKKALKFCKKDRDQKRIKEKIKKLSSSDI